MANVTKMTNQVANLIDDVVGQQYIEKEHMASRKAFEVLKVLRCRMNVLMDTTLLSRKMFYIKHTTVCWEDAIMYYRKNIKKKMIMHHRVFYRSIGKYILCYCKVI